MHPNSLALNIHLHWAFGSKSLSLPTLSNPTLLNPNPFKTPQPLPTLTRTPNPLPEFDLFLLAAQLPSEAWRSKANSCGSREPLQCLAALPQNLRRDATRDAEIDLREGWLPRFFFFSPSGPSFKPLFFSFRGRPSPSSFWLFNRWQGFGCL